MDLKKSDLTILALQIVLAFAFLWFLFQTLNIDISLAAKSVSISPAVSEQPYIFLGAILIAIIALQIFISKKFPFAYELQKNAGNLISSTTKSKIADAKNDPRILALNLIEFVFAVLIAMSIAAYLDPEFVLIDWEKRNLSEPFTTILNVTIFIVLTALFLFVYKYTKEYRETFTHSPPVQQLARRIRKE